MHQPTSSRPSSASRAAGARDGVFSSESVSEGHPDKLADRISDRILDAFLAQDPGARVACETMLAGDQVIVAGEFRARDVQVFRDVRARVVGLVAEVLRDAGYRDRASGIDPDLCDVQVRFRHQAAEIASCVDRADGTLGAGDQGLVFGHACDETPESMPAPIQAAHRLMRRHAELRRSGHIDWLRPDAKAQVSFRYEDGRPVEVVAIVLSTQHAPDVPPRTLHDVVAREIVDVVIPVERRSHDCRVLINPSGSFVTGGPAGDTGLTGRKVVVDTHRGRGRNRRLSVVAAAPTREASAALFAGALRPPESSRGATILRPAGPWRRGPARRRRVLRQGSLEGRPLGGVLRAIPRA